jgi:hypothetical protein
VRAFVLTALLLALGACWSAQEDVAAGDDGGQEPQDYGECETAADCVLAASTCCACADFSMPDMGWQDGCADIECPMPADCPAIAAACVDGACTTTCAPVACDLSCSDGFASDAAGCLVCACAGGEVPPSTCLEDADCVQIPADCCGCAQGGADTAAPADTAEAIVEAMMCSNDPACPQVDVCDPGAAPRCVSGTCALVPASSDGLDVGCGRPDLPMCPEGTVCVLNADSDAQSQGVGTCQPPV